MIMDKILERLQEIRAKGPMHRLAEVGQVDASARTAVVSFSSEIEYERWFGIEILDHTPGAVRMDRLNDGAAVLWNHDWDDQRGVVVSAVIDADRKGRAVLRFSKSPKGDQLFQDIQDGIITKVSVGYRVHGIKLLEVNDDQEKLLVTDWEPYEISMVSVPADPTVGVGRSADKPQEEQREKTADNDTIEAPEPDLTTKKRTIMEKKLYDAQGNYVRADVDDDGNIVKVIEVLLEAGANERAQTARGTEAERKRQADIAEMGKQYEQKDLALEFIGNGKSPEEFQRALLAKMAERNAKPGSERPAGQRDAGNIGLNDDEKRSYSLFRAIRALQPNATQADREEAAFEFECSRAAEKQYGKSAQGILIPDDVLDSRAMRAFNAGGAANTPTGAQTGSNLVATNHMAGAFIEMLRNRATIMKLAHVMGGLVGNVDIPKQIGGATAYWVGEDEDATEGTPVIGQVELSPKTVAAYTDITRRLVKQATPDAEGIVWRDLMNAAGLAIDFAGYYGTGANNQPRGIKNYTGINAVTFAGAQPTYPELVAMESAISADNADVNSMAYVFNAMGRGAMKTTQKFEGTNGAPIWEPGNTVNGYRTEITNQIALNEYFFGNFADIIVGLWGGMDMMVDPYAKSKSGGLRILVFQDVDFALRRTESFCLGAPATP